MVRDLILVVARGPTCKTKFATNTNNAALCKDWQQTSCAKHVLEIEGVFLNNLLSKSWKIENTQWGGSYKTFYVNQQEEAPSW